MAENHRGISAIERLEHSDENDAKKVNLYVWNGSAWVRSSSSGPTDNTASGTISTRNLVPAGVATANSAVEITLGEGQNTIAFQTVGTYTGALTLQGTVNGTNWVSFAGTPILNANTGLYLATVTSALQSTFFAKVSGFTKVRISALAAVTGSVVVTIAASAGDSFQGAMGVLTSVTTVTTLTNITNWGNVVDNGAFVDGTTRLMPGGYIYDEVAGTALTENDAAAARIDAKRSQIGVIEDATTRGQRASVSAAGALKVDGVTSSQYTTSTASTVAASATSVTLKASNAARKELIIRNDSSSILYIEEGATATTSSVFKLNQDDYYSTNNYTGIVTGIWVSATGNAQIKES